MNYAVVIIFFCLVQYCIVQGETPENAKFQSFRTRIHQVEIQALPQGNVLLFPDIILALLMKMEYLIEPRTKEIYAALEMEKGKLSDRKLLSSELTIYYQNVSLFAGPRINPKVPTELIDLSIEDAPNILNKWISDQSGKKIEKFYKGLFDPRLGALLVGAGHFESFWKYPFPQAKTKEGIFYNGENEIRVPFMENQQTVLYYASAMFQSFGIPCTKGNRHFYIILPATGISLARLNDFLIFQDYENVFRNSEPTRIRYKVPKFSLKYRSSLKNTLQILGIVRSFMPQISSFSLLTDSRIHIDDVTYESVLNVFESGTNAASAVSIEMVTSNLTSPSEHSLFDDARPRYSGATQAHEITVNRPFLYVIYNSPFNYSDSILLSGAIYNPQ